MFQLAITNTFVTNKKKYWKINIKKNQVVMDHIRDFRTVKYNDQNLKSSLYGLSGRTEMTE